MANWATTAYVIEGPKETLLKILGSIYLAINSDVTKYEEYKACIDLGFTEKELKGKRLRGEITEEPKMENGILRFSAEEAWGLQDFEALLRQKFPDIKIYWTVEEVDCELFTTNDRDGKYFPERYYVDICIDGIYESEYFETMGSVLQWLSDRTHGTVKSDKDIEVFNTIYEDYGADDENYIYIHKFTVCD